MTPAILYPLPFFPFFPPVSLLECTFQEGRDLHLLHFLPCVQCLEWCPVYILDSILSLNDWTDFNAVRAFDPLGCEKEFTKALSLVVIFPIKAYSSHYDLDNNGPRLGGEGEGKQANTTEHIHLGSLCWINQCLRGLFPWLWFEKVKYKQRAMLCRWLCLEQDFCIKINPGECVTQAWKAVPWPLIWSCCHREATTWFNVEKQKWKEMVFGLLVEWKSIETQDGLNIGKAFHTPAAGKVWVGERSRPRWAHSLDSSAWTFHELIFIVLYPQANGLSPPPHPIQTCCYFTLVHS